MIDFAPMPLKQKTLKAEPITRYRVEPPTGESVVVVAASAAEAFRRSGLAEAWRIVNLDVERLNLVAAGLLEPEDVTVSTVIGLDESGLPEFFSAELPEEGEELEPFAEMTLSELSEFVYIKPERLFAATPAPDAQQQAAPKPVPPQAPPSEPTTSVVVEEDTEREVYEISVLPQGSLETTRDLTPEEVRNLLNSEKPNE